MSEGTIKRGSESYTGRHNWGAGQPVKYGSEDIESYRSDAAERIETYDALISDIVGSFNFRMTRSEICTKEDSSCLRKLWDRNSSIKGDPSKITDYLRTTITVGDGPKGVENLTRLIEVLANHPNTIAFKDQFWQPDEGTGYRSFKAIMDVDGHAAELKVEYEGMDTAYQLTESMRNFERLLKRAEEDFPARCTSTRDKNQKIIGRFTAQAETTIAEIRNLRKQCHDSYAHACGLDSLIDPELQEKQKPCLVSDFMRSVREARDATPFGKGLKTLVGRLEQLVPT